MNDQGPDLSAVPVIQLEALRLRLTQLVHSLNKLQTQVQHTHIASWPVLQQQFGIILAQLTAVSSTLAGSAENLQRTVSYPLAEFPTAQQAGLLTTLLGKKYPPEVAEWIEDGKTIANDVRIKQDQDFCAWALETVENEMAQHEWTGFLTKQQSEEGQVDSGISRKQGSSTVSTADGFQLDEVLSYISRSEIPPRLIRTNPGR